MSSPLRNLLVTATLSAMLPAMGVAADLYRWSDNKGNVHYTDRVPPEYVKNGYRVINQQGQTISTVEAQKEVPTTKKSDAEVKAQTERDRRLLITYSSTDEINAARDRKVAEIKTAISLRQDSLSLLEKQFREQTREASDYEKQGAAVPDTLRANINTTKKKILAHEESIKQQQQQLVEAQKLYAEELERYTQIKQMIIQQAQ